MKILFCIYQLDYADHISVAYLSAVARKRGHQTHFCTLPDFDGKLREVKPDLVAYSLNIFGFEQMAAAHKRARKEHRFLSIGGGPQATFNPQLFEQTGMDAYCVGEGELAFDEFLSKVEAGSSYDTVANLITPNATNEVRPRIASLDSLPFPDRDLVLSNSFLKDTPKKTFYATRGCPFSCYYCANNYYNEIYRGKGKIIRRFSVDRIIEEIKYVGSRYRMKFVKIGDDLFAPKADEWLEDFSRRYQKEVNIPFNCFLRFDTVNDDILKLLKACNCYSVHLSVDSTSEHVREKVLGRKMRPVKIEEKLRLINSYGIKTWVNFMLAAPDSALEDDLETIELGRRGRVTYSAFSTTVPTRGTRLYDQVVSRNLIDPPNYSQDMTGCSRRSQLSCFSDKEKDIRYNIFLLGPLVSRLPTPLRQLGRLAIKHTPPNDLYLAIRQWYYTHSIENTIFKLH
jgi:anaerobic magnesium-protoporphyrin IX monomethyl ester cyclase